MVTDFRRKESGGGVVDEAELAMTGGKKTGPLNW
jgi:hypothetical protein